MIVVLDQNTDDFVVWKQSLQQKKGEKENVIMLSLENGMFKLGGLDPDQQSNARGLAHRIHCIN